ncbi:hypothetical protein HQQ94_03180 [Shewanella sp. VB17]|uniref:sensor histidine kinase n=1 Tax=Shewanella sp. VB17 TaxID=2739432 RepID=UPI001566DC8D|nr:HAMP domain-containing sensor histidine kinase [Shewanella sp. VB17]NRD72257.1 hypothetical protein [Shewanella sp. VB17]
MLGNINISTKLFTSSLLFSAVMAFILLYMLLTVRVVSQKGVEQQNLVKLQIAAVKHQGEMQKLQQDARDKHLLVSDIYHEFRNLRAWLLDLSLSGLDEAKKQAIDTKTILDHKLEELSGSDRALAMRLSEQVEHFYLVMNQAVDSYVAGPRVKGHSLVGESRLVVEGLEQDLLKFMKESDMSFTDLNQQQSEAGTEVIRSGELVKNAADKVAQKNAELFISSFVCLLLITGFSFFYNFMMRREICQPIERFVKTVEHVEQELDLTRRFDVCIDDETDTDTVGTAFNRLMRNFEKRVSARTAELQKNNEELSHILDELKFTKNELMAKEKMAALGGLVASITHEINTPLGVCLSAASHLDVTVNTLNDNYLNGELTEDELNVYIKDFLDCSKLLLSNLERATKLIQSFKKVSVDQSHEEIQDFDLKVYVDEVFFSLGPLLSRTSLELSYTCPEYIMIRSNPGAFYQIISNLCNNAILHAFDERQPGALTLDITQTDIGVDLVFKDNGRGMSEEIKDKIFVPFFTTKRGKGGSGLGMNIVYNLVTKVLGGKIHVESELGHGTQFNISLPGSILVNDEVNDNKTLS